MPKLLHGLGVGLAASAVCVTLLFWNPGWLGWFEGKTWDLRVSYLCKPGPTGDKIRLILLDQKSLDWGEKELGLSWPWPREVYKPIINFCRRSGAKALAFDVLFNEPSFYGVKDDQDFGEAIAQFPSFAGTLLLGANIGSTTTWPDDVPVFNSDIKGLNEWLPRANQLGIVIPRATFPIPEVSTNATILGNVQANPDSDGVNRRVRLFSLFDEKLVPSLGLAILLSASPDKTIELKPSFIKIGLNSVPLNKNGYSILNYRPSGTYKTFSAAAVIQSELRSQSGETPPIKDLEALKDCYVFFGFTAPGLFDLWPTPISRNSPGVEIHATMLDNLLSNDFIQEAPWWATVSVTIVLALICGIAASLSRRAWESLLVSLICLAVPVMLCIGAYKIGIWLPFVVQESAAVLTLFGAIVLNYATEGRQKRFIKSAFKQYLSHTVIEHLIQHPERLKLGGERRCLSIFFSDLQGFTGISESLEPEELTTLLNDYLTAMTDIIQEEAGTVDKYEGDAIIAFWNAPLEQLDHAERAVRAALRCQEKLAKLRPRFYQQTGKDLFMRIGIHTGPVVVGNMGSHSRFDYTIIGDAANLASRLEGINKHFGTYTMISDATADLIGEVFATREIARVEVVGRKRPVRIFEPMSWEDFKTRKAYLSVFAQALDAYYQGRFQEALELFHSIETRDPVSAVYAIKCKALIDHPPAQWQGVWLMTEK